MEFVTYTPVSITILSTHGRSSKTDILMEIFQNFLNICDMPRLNKVKSNKCLKATVKASHVESINE